MAYRSRKAQAHTVRAALITWLWTRVKRIMSLPDRIALQTAHLIGIA